MKKQLTLMFLSVLICLTQQLQPGGCMSSSSGKVSPVYQQPEKRTSTFSVVTPGTTEAARRNQYTNTELFSHKKTSHDHTTSSDSLSDSEDEKETTIASNSSIKSAGISFGGFKKFWIDFRYNLVSLRGLFHEFRAYYTTLCRLRDKRPDIVYSYLQGCNQRLKRSSGKKPQRPFKTTTGIEKAYTRAKNLFEDVMAIASNHLYMGQTTLPSAGFKPSQIHPQTDIVPLHILKDPECPWCKAAAKTQGIRVGAHKNFDSTSRTFYDVCPDCKKSFLRQLYEEESDLMNQINTALKITKETHRLLWCIYPKAPYA